ncbi:MAG: DUF2384 domain-containing protein [Anaerolineae bacterium]|nr:DUF2384 domain-containing protein [Anaerolineae bacterium]
MAGRTEVDGGRRVYRYSSSATSGQDAISYAKLIGLDARSERALADKVEDGFDYRAFTQLQMAIKLPVKQLADLMSITDRTLSRRKSEGRLRPDESERLLRLARVFDLALGLFGGDKQAARNWLTRPIDALGGRAPIALSKTEVGAREVESLIHRLEHGIFT